MSDTRPMGAWPHLERDERRVQRFVWALEYGRDGVDVETVIDVVTAHTELDDDDVSQTLQRLLDRGELWRTGGGVETT